jgi:acyl phosphate:glycerol-3-phosphate acyltransferase
MLEIILVILAYLIGSVSTALFVSKVFYGIDIREHGSGNAGATNTFRVLGQKAGIAVMVVDILKGALATKLILLHQGYSSGNEIAYTNFMVILGIAAVVGHIFPIWANFKGGKGIATLFGMIISIQPIVAMCLVFVFVLMLVVTQYVSLSSISASIAFPILIFFIFREPEIMYRLFAVATAVMVVLTHHKNINRLVNGNESKMSLFKGKKGPQQ